MLVIDNIEQKGGWADVTKANNDEFMRTVKERAIKAKYILNQYYKEEDDQ